MQPARCYVHLGGFTPDWLNFSGWINLGFCVSRACTLLSLCEAPAEVLGWELCCCLAAGKNKMCFCSGKALGETCVNTCEQKVPAFHYLTPLFPF